MKIFSMFVLCSLLSGCVTTETFQSRRSTYESAMEDKRYDHAREHLESVIDSDVTHLERQYFILALMNDLMSGSYGYYDQNAFLYWGNRLGDEIDVGLGYLVQEVPKFQEQIEDDFEKASSYYLNSLAFCEEKQPLLPSTLDKADSNGGFLLTKVIDCYLDSLHSSHDARELYQYYLNNISARDNANEKALGVKLYSEKTNYGTMSPNEKKALLTFLIQLVGQESSVHLKISSPGNVSDETFAVISSRMDSRNPQDWTIILNQLDKENSSKSSTEQSKEYLYDTVLTAAYGARQVDVYERLRKAYGKLPPSARRNDKYFQMLYLMLLEETGYYDKGLSRANVMLETLNQD